MKRFVLLSVLLACVLLGCTERDNEDGHNKTLGDYIIEDLMDD